MIALLLKQPSLQIDAEEATQLAKAVKEVLKYHRVNVSPQAMAYMQLAACAATIYGPKIALIVMMQNAQRKSKPQVIVRATPDMFNQGESIDPIVTQPGMMRFN